MIIFSNDACVIHKSGAMILRRSVRAGEVLARLQNSQGKSLIIRAGDPARAGEVLLGNAETIQRFLARR